MGVSFELQGDFTATRDYLKRLSRAEFYSHLDRLAQAGVDALEKATPKETGYTAGSWSYKITKKRGSCTISWHNSSVNGGVPIVVLLQHGHGTGTGGYVQGRDFINPALRPVFNNISDQVWKEVKR